MFNSGCFAWFALLSVLITADAAAGQAGGRGLASLPVFLRDARCPEALKDLLSGWKASDDWSVRPGDIDGGKAHMAPTDAVGTWVRISIYPDHSVEATRFTPKQTDLVTWKRADCRASAKIVPRKPVTGSRWYTDSRLAADLAAAKQGALIYLWTPQMPLSVRGLTEASRIAARMKLAFIPVLDGSFPQSELSSLKADRQLSRPYRIDATIELGARQMRLHFPSTLVYSRGRFSPVYPGYWDDPLSYERFIKDYL